VSAATSGCGFPGTRIKPMAAASPILATGTTTLKPRVVIDHATRLGAGAFGSIYAAAWRDDDTTKLAVKVMDQAALSEKAKQQLRREVGLHATVSHDHVLRCHGAYEADARTLHLVLDRMLGDVASAIRAAPEAVRVLTPKFIRALLLALRHLHDENGIVHADIKPSNLLVDERATLRLCDLGAACRLQQCGGGRSTLVGSPAYLAPEVVAIAHLGLDVSGGASYGFACDLWSAGVCLVEMLTTRLPFAAVTRDQAALPAAICFRQPALEPTSAFSARARALTLRLLSKQAYLRPSADEVLRDEGGVEDDGGGGGRGYLVVSAPGSPAHEAEEAAARECVAALATRRGCDELEPLCLSAGTMALASPPPPPPPACELKQASAVRTPVGSSSGSGSSRMSSESPMSLPSWTSSLVDASP